MSPRITVVEYESPRKGKELVDWVREWQERLLLDEELARDFRRRTGFWKQFAYEALPIAYFLNAITDRFDGATVTLKSGSQSFDAEVSHAGETFRIEVTSTTDVVDAYQREYLNNHSTCPGDPTGVASGTDLARARIEGFPQNPGQAIWGNSAQEGELAKVVDRLKSKNANPNYKAGTVLIIHCADRILDRWTEERIKSWLTPRLGVVSPAPFNGVWLTLEDERCLKLL
jgi:hypothetical protein